MKEDRIDQLFKGLCARKISIVSRLADLSPEEIKIIRMRWLEGKSDIQVCDELGMSLSTLFRKRAAAKERLASAMDLYGLRDLDDLPAESLLDYNGKFYKCQDELVRYFIRNRSEEAHDLMYNMLRFMASKGMADD